MRIGIMGAMAEEVELLREDLRGEEPIDVAGRTYRKGRLYDQDVILVTSRLGKVASAATAATLIGRYRVSLVVFVGVAGAALPDLNVGDLVVASSLLQHDLDARPLFPQFEVPLLGRSRFDVPVRLQETARRAAAQFLAGAFRTEIAPDARQVFGLHAPKVVTGLIASGDQFISDPRRLAALRHQLPELACVEMEGAAVAQVCHEHEIPLSVVRSISDRADHQAAIDFTQFLTQVASRYSRGVLRELLPMLAVAEEVA